jgi:UDP-2-acetamido-3-amino-2,3-dideoxy-glucuronate N-acetyltransferase
VTVRISLKASVSKQALLADTVTVWDYSQIRENVKIKENTIIGSYVYIDANVEIGKNCKIQNRALLYDPAKLHDGVFIGPGVILTNDKNPRSVSPSVDLKGREDWTKVGVEIFEGASISSGAVCVAPIKIGKWAMIGAGAVVTKNVPDFALMVGNPARQIGWVGKSGLKLETTDNVSYKCSIFGTTFRLIGDRLVEN